MNMAASKKSTDIKAWLLGSGLFVLVAGFLTSTALVSQTTDSRSAAFGGTAVVAPVPVPTLIPSAAPTRGTTQIIKGTTVKPTNSAPGTFKGTPRQGLK